MGEYDTAPTEQLEPAHAVAGAEPWGVDAGVLDSGGGVVRRAIGALSGGRWLHNF